MAEIDAWVAGALPRFLVYAVSAMAGSGLGALFTWRDGSTWVDANPLVASMGGVVVLGPAAAIAAMAPVGRWSTAAVAMLSFATLVLLWWLFANNESSTSSFVFFYGWLIGIPTATVFAVAATYRRERAQR